MRQDRLRINLQVKISDKEHEYYGESGIIKGHDVDGGYWVRLNGHEGSYYFHSGEVVKDVTENILEILVSEHQPLPEEIERELEGKQQLPELTGTFYTIFRYNLKCEAWNALRDMLSYHKTMAEDIIDYEVQHHN